MNAKYIFALILVLQVSMSLCTVVEPSPEMVDLYNTHKATFMKRLMNFYNKVHAAATPVLEGIRDNEHAQDAREFAENLQSKPEFQTFMKVATAIRQEAGGIERMEVNNTGEEAKKYFSSQNMPVLTFSLLRHHTYVRGL
uniref:Apolipoprotein A-II n=1 Tax=Oreochromis niloticus TaxID=8128 RepID=I3KGU9_ORENI